MRVSLTLVLSLLLAGAAVRAASAETRMSSRIIGGLGVGGGHAQSLKAAGSSYLVAADLLWRRQPERSWMLSLEAGGAGGGGTHLLNGPTYDYRRLDYVRHEAGLIGLERSPAGSASGSYIHGGVGLGLVTSEYSSRETRGGLALGAGAGFRLISPARELGFSFGLRTSHVIARGARSHFLALTFGAAINPR